MQLKKKTGATLLALSVVSALAIPGIACAQTNGATLKEAAEVQLMDIETTVSGSTTRFSGDTDYETMQGVVTNFFEESSTSTVIVTSSANFPDALAASGFAGLTRSPILITNPDTTSYEVVQSIHAMDDVENAIIIGGTAAVSQSVEDDLNELSLNVTRIGGADRFDTADLLYAAGEGKWKHETAIVVSGTSPADALSVSPIAWQEKEPIFLVDADGNMNAEDEQTLISGAFDTIIIVGGTAVVSQETEDALAGSVETVTRLAGADRFKTSYEVATYGMDGHGLNNRYLYFVTGKNDSEGTIMFQDALFTGAAAGKSESPMILVADNMSSKGTLRDLSAGKEYVIGDTSKINSSLMEYINKYC